MSDKIYQAINAAVDEQAAKLLDVSHAIHGKPELAFKEHFACQTLTRSLNDYGLKTETGVFTLDTAFEASFDNGLGNGFSFGSGFDNGFGSGFGNGFDDRFVNGLGDWFFHALR